MTGKRREAEEEVPEETGMEVEEEVGGGGFIVAISTAPDARTAGRIARKVVEERLAACVNILGPVKSVFRWEGRIVQTDERLLVMKTTMDRTPALGERVEELHPYETPEFLSLLVVGGVQSYLDWILDSVEVPESADETADD